MLIEIAALKILKVEPDRPSKDIPLLFVHGMWEGAWLWKGYLDFFSSCGYTCYALNLRGHDGSKPATDIGKVSIHDYIADARTVAEELNNPVLIGHSMGGLLVQKLAELLEPPAIVAIAPAAPRGIFALKTWAVFQAALRHSPEIFLRRPLMPSKATMLRLELNRLPPDEQDRIYSVQMPESGRQTFDIAVKGLPVDASKVGCPVLVIGATEDQITAAKMVKKIARKYQADYKEYDGFAHMIVLEPGWERVAQDIATWLEKAVQIGGAGGAAHKNGAMGACE